MFYRFWQFLDHLFFYWRSATISARNALAIGLVIAAISYLIGAKVGSVDQRQLQNELSGAQETSRILAREMTRRNASFENLRARNALDKKVIKLLHDEMTDMNKSQLKKEAEVAFFRQVFNTDSPVGRIRAYTLEAIPDLVPQQWQLNAILVHLDKKNSFSGHYYFEFVEDSNGEEVVQRLPTEGAFAFELDIYLELKQTVSLQDRSHSISDLRIVVLDQNNEIVTSSKTSFASP